MVQLVQADESVKMLVWHDAERQGDKNGQQNTQCELHPKNVTAKESVAMFKKSSNVCMPHCQETCRVRLLMKFDLRTLPLNTLLMFADHAAVMILRAVQVNDSSVDGHAINDTFVCLCLRRKCTLKEKKEANGRVTWSEDEIEMFSVDAHHFFASTISKGKK